MKKILALLSVVCLVLTTAYTGTLDSVADSGAAVTFVQSFEDESLSLSNGNFSFSSEESRTGSKSLKLVKDGSSSTDNSFAAVFLNAEDELEADTPYIVSFYIKPVTISGEIELQFFRNSVINSHSGNASADLINKFNLTSAQISALPTDQNGWYKVIVSSEFYKDAAKPYMNFWNCQWAGDATFYLDDITFEPILAPEIKENLIEADAEHWSFGQKYGSAGFDGQNIKVSGGTGLATFIGKTVKEETIRVKLSSNVTADWAGIAFRNQADINAIKSDGQNAYFYDIGDSYVVQWTTNKLSLKRNFKENNQPKWENIVDAIDFNMQDGKDHTVEIKTTDDSENNKTYIEVYVDGILRLSATDTTTAIKDAGYVQIVASGESDSVTVKGFEIDGLKVEDFVKTAPTVTGNNLVKNTNSWFFNKGWVYDGYTGTTGIVGDNITVSGDYGTALFKGAKLADNYAELKFKTNLSTNGLAFIGLRNAVTDTDLETNGNLASALSEKAKAYVLRIMKTGVVLGVRASNGNFTPLGTEYAFESSFDINAQENTVITRILDNTATNSSVIEVWFNGKCVIEYTDTEYAIKPEGFYSVTVADNKNNSDYLTVTSLKYDKEIEDIIIDEGEEPIKEAPLVSGNNLVKNKNSWFFNKGWVYEGYTGTTGFVGDNITVSGDYGTALFKGAKLADNYAELKFKTNLSNKGVAFIGLRNAVTDTDLETNGNLASALSEKANAYVLRIMKTGIVLGVRASNGNFTPLGTEYAFENSFDINAQENTVITRILDNTATNSSVIEVWFNGKCIIEYTDTEYAIKPEGFYSVTVADNKNNSDYFTVTSLKYDKEIKDIVLDVYAPATEIKENLLSADSQNWIFGREWAPNTGINNGTLTVTGGTGVATFTGKQVGTQSILFKLATNLKSEWAAVSFRNQVSVRDLEKNGQNGYFMSSGNAYTLVFTNEGVSLKVVYDKDKWKNLGDTYAINLSDGKEHLYEIVTEDFVERKTTKIEVYIDGKLCISATDNEYAVKDAGYVSFVCSNKTDGITVNGFEIVGEKLNTYKQGSPKVFGKNAVSDTTKWYFDKGWIYEGFTGTTGVTNGKITVSGDYGTALYKGEKIGQNYAELKFNTKLTDKGMIFIGLRNAVSEADIEKDKYAASTMSDKAQGYVIRIMKDSIALGIKGKDGNFKTLGTKYDFKSGFDINAQLNRLTTRILDDAATNSSRIEVWFNGERIMVYIDEEYAIKKDGFYSITVADGKTNTDSITVTSLKIGSGVLSPQTGDTSNESVLFVLFAVLCLGILTVTVRERNKYEE